MRLFNKLILAAVLFAASSDAVFAVGPRLNVLVKDQNGIGVPGVQVAAVEFGMNGPSTFTQAGVTDADGKITPAFNLVQDKNYNIYYSSHGYSPSISDQFNSPVYDPNRNVYATGATVYYSTFTLTSGLTGVGRIQQQFIGASANTVLFGGVYNMKSQMQAGTGLAPTDGSGNGILTVDNVPFAEANTYNINLYDPQKNNGIGRNVMTELSVGTPTVAYVGAGPTLDFNKSVPAGRVENTAAQGGTAATGASVEGVLKSTDGLTVPHMGIAIKACIGSQWNSWANSDDNGRFQLYGLTPGVTYYLQVMGGCTWSQADSVSRCYEPFVSPNYNAPDICLADAAKKTGNDILYASSDVQYSSVTLNLMPPSIGQITVCVKTTEGYAIPNANVSLNPDGSPWPNTATSCQSNDYTKYSSSAGFSNANTNTGSDGCATLGALPSGNYMVNVWTPFSSGGNGANSFNGNGDDFTGFGTNGGTGTNWVQAHCFGTGANDYRITVDTAATPTMSVYNSSGAVQLNWPGGVALSSVTYTVAAGGNASGEVSGTLSFPEVTDLRSNPIMITLYPNCSDGNCGSGNFAAIASSGSARYHYSIHVASGATAAYYMNIKASGWGRVNRGGGDNSVRFGSSTSAVVNMDFARAGTLTGTMYKPDGTIFTPADNQYVYVDADNNNGWSNVNLQKDGTFTMTDVLPGVNRINIGASGGSGSSSSFNYSLPSPAPTVSVTAGSTATLNINLVNANYVGVDFDLSKVPDPTVVKSGSDLLLGFKAVPMLAGSVFNSDTVIKMLTGDDSDTERKFRYSPPTGPAEEGQCGYSWSGGFCPAAMPSPGVYDFYLMRSGDFGKGGAGITDWPYPHFTMLNSLKNVVVDTAHSTTTIALSNNSGGGTASGVLVKLTPADMSARGNATVYGAVTAVNFFRAVDYEALGGDFDKFVAYLPVVTLYDEAGTFSAAGITVPSPEYISNHDDQFNETFAQGYQTFKDMISSIPGGLGFEIRGLAPNKCYTAVLSTPNYPHFQGRVCAGGNGSRKKLDVDLDAAGAGAVVAGVVMSSFPVPVPIPNASVELALEGSVARTAVTTASGTFRFEGLSGGVAKITVTAPGFAKLIQEEALVGNNTYTEGIFLSSAPGSITGTVYSQKLPFAKVQPGAQIVAYDDTYNGNHPSLPLPLLKTMTGTDGTYTLDGLVPGDIYKVFLKVPGKYTLSAVSTATAGTVTGVDFTMLPKPLDIEVFANKNDTAQTYEFTILNPQDFKTGVVTVSRSPYDPVNVSTVNMTQLSSGELHGSIPLGPLAAGQVYVLHGEAVSLSNKTVVKEILFGKGYKGSSEQSIDDIMLGDDSEDGRGRRNNEASLDNSGEDPSALVIPAGALIVSTAGAIPSCSFKAEDKNSAGVAAKVASLGADAFAGSLYTVALSSVASTDRSIEITLAYDKSASNLDDLSVAQYNDATSKWENVPGVATINPVKGTIKVKVKKLASVLSTRGASTPQAVFDGRQYVVRPQSGGASSSVGTLAVIRPSVAGGALAAGAKMKVFNYPNPFNLKNKAIANSHGAGLPGSTYGTVIHVEVPAANGGPGHIRIYTLAGELVRDLKADFTAGSYNYVVWDGRNKDGREVANGVYYGVVDVAGKSPDRKDATFKMAVIK